MRRLIAHLLLSLALIASGAQYLHAQMMGMQTGAAYASGGGGSTLNPSDAGSNIVLSNGNLTATVTTANNQLYGVRSTTSKSSGKWYFEATVSGMNSNYATAVVAVANASEPLNYGGNYCAYDTNATCYFTKASGAAYFYNASSCDGTATNTSNGDVIGVAVDVGGGTVKFNDNNGTFSGTCTIPTGALFVFVVASTQTGVSGVVTVNFCAAGCASPPAGYSAWD